jgi:hypothetical protein
VKSGECRGVGPEDRDGAEGLRDPDDEVARRPLPLGTINRKRGGVEDEGCVKGDMNEGISQGWRAKLGPRTMTRTSR